MTPLWVWDVSKWTFAEKTVLKDIPQGLKPAHIIELVGTTEVVP
jgi:hypothetical protein